MKSEGDGRSEEKKKIVEKVQGAHSKVATATDELGKAGTDKRERERESRWTGLDSEGNWSGAGSQQKKR